jgi:hypothetical protein
LVPVYLASKVVYFESSEVIRPNYLSPPPSRGQSLPSVDSMPPSPIPGHKQQEASRTKIIHVPFSPEAHLSSVTEDYEWLKWYRNKLECCTKAPTEEAYKGYRRQVNLG